MLYFRLFKWKREEIIVVHNPLRKKSEKCYRDDVPKQKKNHKKCKQSANKKRLISKLRREDKRNQKSRQKSRKTTPKNTTIYLNVFYPPPLLFPLKQPKTLNKNKVNKAEWMLIARAGLFGQPPPRSMCEISSFILGSSTSVGIKIKISFLKQNFSCQSWLHKWIDTICQTVDISQLFVWCKHWQSRARVTKLGYL